MPDTKPIDEPNKSHRVMALTNNSGQQAGYLVHCPACDRGHFFDVEKPGPKGQQWKFNGNMVRPTFSPSMLVHRVQKTQQCHSFVTDGKIRYLSDCDHSLAGQTVELPVVDEWDADMPAPQAEGVEP